MPKTKIDYSNTIIYKIFCKDENTLDFYIGHTTNFFQRKATHKINCENSNGSSYNTKLYKTIRENGGWNNWNMQEIEVLNLKNSTEARIKEAEYYQKLKANLNCISPCNIKNVFICDICETPNFNSKKIFDEHLNSQEHEYNLLKIEQNKTQIDKFFCVNCNFKCSYKRDFERHNETKKHKEMYEKYEKQIKKYNCECGKIYSTRQSLFNHKKKCSHQEITIEDNSPLNEKEIIMTLLQQNNQLQNQIIELCKDKSVTNINNTGAHINSHNKTFNLNVFLNETCKDAMNIMDFVDSLKLQLSDLESVGRLGYVEGISNIIIKNLKEMDVHKRPVHCSDSKREVMYIKDEDKWEKENENKNKLRKVIKKVACKNQRLLPKFKEEHPDCGKYHSKYSDQYNKLVVESMGGSGDNDSEKEDKIIRKIAKNVLIDKSIELID